MGRRTSCAKGGTQKQLLDWWSSSWQTKLVGVTGFKLNQQLARHLRSHPLSSSAPVPLPYSRPVGKRICDRLSEKDITELLAAFRVGVPKHVLAEEYGISLTSVKRVLRKHGARGQQHGRQY